MMKQRSKRQEGATLVEILIAIAIGSIITLAVTTVLLLGLRIHHKTSEVISHQNSVRVVVSLFENVASDGMISKIESEEGAWSIFVRGEEAAQETEFASYDPEEKTIYLRDMPILEGVSASSIQPDGKLLTFAVETEYGKVSSSVYCRTFEKEEEAVKVTIQDLNRDSSEDRQAFIDVLLGQEGTTLGAIRNDPDYQFYYQWYLGEHIGNAGTDWNEGTPWCGCFISWGLHQVKDRVQDPPPKDLEPKGKWSANVDILQEFFEKENETLEGAWMPQTAEGKEPETGDLIFFDLKNDGTASHVGAVVGVQTDDDGNTWVYTIEGNTDDTDKGIFEASVLQKKYLINDDRILGYGVLIWDNNSAT